MRRLGGGGGARAVPPLPGAAGAARGREMWPLLAEALSRLSLTEGSWLHGWIVSNEGERLGGGQQTLSGLWKKILQWVTGAHWPE